MGNVNDDSKKRRHLSITRPSPWVTRFAPLVRQGGTVLDLACGGGRHSRSLLDLGYTVVAVDLDVEPVAHLATRPKLEIIRWDLEQEGSWPLPGRLFDGIVVSNYLHRPLFPVLVDSLGSGGVLIYETFARGNEAYSRPRNPDHLLLGGELLAMTQGRLQIIAYEHGFVEDSPCPGVIQRICAVNNLAESRRQDGQPDALPVIPRSDDNDPWRSPARPVG